MAQARVDSSDSDFDANLAAFQRHLRAEKKAPSTIVTYAKAVDQLAAFLGRQGMPQTVGGVRREHVEAFLIDRRTAATGRPRSRNGSARCSSFFESDTSLRKPRRVADISPERSAD